MEVFPGDIVIRTAPVPKSMQQRSNPSGLHEHRCYEVEAVVADMLQLVSVRGWHSARCFDVVLDEPCA